MIGIEDGPRHHVIRWIAVAAICLALFGCGKSDDSQKSGTTAADNSSDSSASAPAPTPPSPDELAQQQRPSDQVNLEALLKKVNDAETSTGNGIIDQENYDNAYHAYCTKMQENGLHKDWTAEVRDIYPASSDTGKPAIHLVTPGGLEALQEVDEQSPLYKVIRALKEGDYVKFSVDVTHAQEVGAPPYQECDTTNSDNGRPHLNVYLVGDVTELSPLR